MVKIRSAEWFVLVAIVASAVAMQVRERLAGPAAQSHAQADERSVCGAARGGVLPARCDTEQGVQSAPDLDAPRAMSRHDNGRHTRSQALWV
jgi:hypothetical protein